LSGIMPPWLVSLLLYHSCVQVACADGLRPPAKEDVLDRMEDREREEYCDCKS